MNPTEKKPIPVRNIRFKSVAQIELIKTAAERQGISFNAFVVRIMEVAAHRALRIPPDTLVNQIMPPSKTSRASKEEVAA